MNPSNPNFREGRIEQVESTSGWVKVKILTEHVERNYVTVELTPRYDGGINIHFSGLGSKSIDCKGFGSNMIDITW